jgi:hypothetical protein
MSRFLRSITDRSKFQNSPKYSEYFEYDHWHEPAETKIRKGDEIGDITGFKLGYQQCSIR